LVRLQSKWLRYKRKEKELIKKLNALVGIFLKEYSITISIDEQWLNSVVYLWLAEYEIYEWIFKKLNPRILIVTDQAHTGKIAAANDLKIKVLEYQHGLMDKYYPNYTIAGEYKTSKQFFALQDRTVVFGEFHRKQLLAHGFWDENEVAITGNMQVDEARQKANIATKKKERVTILIPTQGVYRFKNTQQLLDKLLVLDSNKFKVVIRPHPMEPESCIEYFRALPQKTNLIEVREDRISIFDLIVESDLVIGFDSTTLLEAITMSIPAVTISFEGCNKGVHDTLGDYLLEDVIKVLPANTDLPNLLIGMIQDQKYMDNWKANCAMLSGFLYDDNYLENSKALFEEIRTC